MKSVAIKICCAVAILSLLAGCGDWDMGPLDIDWGWGGNVEPPEPPVLQSPRNGAIVANDAVSLSYHSLYAERYHLQLATDKQFRRIIRDSSAVTNTVITLDGLNRSTMYFWRVNASNSYGDSGWSATWVLYTL